jgi:hypothetical protein
VSRVHTPCCFSFHHSRRLPIAWRVLRGRWCAAGPLCPPHRLAPSPRARSKTCATSRPPCSPASTWSSSS